MYKREEVKITIDRSEEIEALEKIQEIINSNDFHVTTRPFNCRGIACDCCPYNEIGARCMVTRLKELTNLMRKNAVDFARKNM